MSGFVIDVDLSDRSSAAGRIGRAARDMAERLLEREHRRLDRDLALAIAYTPVPYRHRITRVIIDGESGFGHVACLLPDGHPALDAKGLSALRLLAESLLAPPPPGHEVRGLRAFWE